MERRYFHLGLEHRVSFRASSTSPHHSVDGQTVDADVSPWPDGSVLVRLGDVTYRALVSVGSDATDVCVDGHLFHLQHRPPPRSSATSGGPARPSGGTMTSPMTGRVRRVLVAEGDAVQAGWTLVVIEAMKMEFPVRASASGTVRRLHLAEGDQIELGAPLLDFEAARLGDDPTQSP